MIFINSKKGQKIFEKIKDKIQYREVDIEKSIEFNPCAVKSCKSNKSRNQFIDNYKESNFNELIDIMIKVKKKSKLGITIIRIINRFKYLFRK